MSAKTSGEDEAKKDEVRSSQEALNMCKVSIFDS